MQQALPWILNSQPDANDREGVLREVMDMTPPHMLPAMVGLLASTAAQPDSAEMVNCIPKLNTLAAKPPPV